MTRRAVLLLSSPASYRLAVFREAAKRAGYVPISGIIGPPSPIPNSSTTVHFAPNTPAASLALLEALSAEWDEVRVLAVDDTAVELAALLASHINQPVNAPWAASASRNKIEMRTRFAAANLPGPQWVPITPGDGTPAPLSFPVVVKPAMLNGSRGVIRANTAEEYAVACARLDRILHDEGFDSSEPVALCESFIPGFELALEGLMTDGELTVLALFDKPDPLDGPFFEETLYVTPSRLSTAEQTAISAQVARMAAALDIWHGPVHAEVRINDEGVWPIEIAARSIGGMCSTVLEFGTGMHLEDLILHNLFGDHAPGEKRSSAAVGAMMIPIPRSGMLRGVNGLEEAKAVPNITGIEITAPLNNPIRTLPEGESYLGFIFASGNSPAIVETALRAAHGHLTFEIAPMLRLAPS